MEPRDEHLRNRAESDLLERCLEVLQGLAPVEIERVEAAPAGAPRPDLVLEVRLEGPPVRYAVEVKRSLRPANIAPLMHRARALEGRGCRLLVCAGRIPDGTGEELRRIGVDYLDTGGNACLRGGGLYVWVAGRRPVRPALGRRNLTGTDLRLLWVFLRDADAGTAVQGELAARAGIALGAVGKGRKQLADLDLLECTGAREWRVIDRAEGLQRFAEGWAVVVRRKLRPRRYRALRLDGPDALERRIRELARPLGCLLGGERAAARLTRGLRTQHATLHVEPLKLHATVEALDLVPDAQGPITLIERFGTGDEYRANEWPPVPMIHPILVWAECLTVPDERVAAVARELHDRLLDDARG